MKSLVMRDQVFLLCLTGIVWGLSLTVAEGQWVPQAEARLVDGFKLTRIYEVPNGQGSWVSMCVDPQGRLIASDQYGGLYRITVDPARETTEVEAIPVPIGRAHGLLCAFDSLYVMAHAGKGQVSGLYRVRDTNGDDIYDSVELLRKIDGEGEHGPHAIVLSPDKRSIYICAGNHTQLPEIARSRVPQVWNEDQLLPRLWDASGHAVGILAPGGWVIKSDPDGKEFELISIGYRNQYDIAFDENGELFTYDADMEWDVGLPWYRPTRICHITSGSEFGWRSGTGKWPEYYPDSLPAAVQIGFGSPTGVCFGTGSRFPNKYQKALFAADWSYGILYAVHLQPQGASYTGEAEIFCTAPGLAITDLVIRPQDGALYFLIGGRQSRSALYRIHYEPKPAPTLELVDLSLGVNAHVQVRHALEQFHMQAPADDFHVAIEYVWPHLKSDDRWIRFAARTAIEHVPAELWR
ncbi:MAG TPA: heme-binding protein, partial [Pirellulaceae bacterium]|nr:heme-binding protein [Pirellulaceae bacterium]